MVGGSRELLPSEEYDKLLDNLEKAVTDHQSLVAAFENESKRETIEQVFHKHEKKFHELVSV
jgi:hypothetical protein